MNKLINIVNKVNKHWHLLHYPFSKQEPKKHNNFYNKTKQQTIVSYPPSRNKLASKNLSQKKNPIKEK